MVPFCYVFTWCKLFSEVSFVRVLIHSWQLHFQDLSTPQRPHLILLLCGLGFQHMNLEEHNHSDHSTYYCHFVNCFLFAFFLISFPLAAFLCVLLIFLLTCFDFSPHFLLCIFYRHSFCAYCGAYTRHFSHNNFFY